MTIPDIEDLNGYHSVRLVRFQWIYLLGTVLSVAAVGFLKVHLTIFYLAMRAIVYLPLKLFTYRKTRPYFLYADKSYVIYKLESSSFYSLAYAKSRLVFFIALILNVARVVYINEFLPMQNEISIILTPANFLTEPVCHKPRLFMKCLEDIGSFIIFCLHVSSSRRHIYKYECIR